MKKFVLVIVSLVMLVIAFASGYLFSRSSNPDLPYEQPTHALDGSVNVPAFKLPPSPYMSDAAVDMLKFRAVMPGGAPDPTLPIEETRIAVDKLLTMLVSSMREKFPVEMQESTIAGVPVRVFTPTDRDIDPQRVLINLHGGAFSVCWNSCSILESAPIAALGGYKVVSVNYRMAPEATHPAGVEDALAVYRQLSQQYRPERIGIYGCSAGGMLTAQTTAKITLDGLPSPGAIGIFGAGALRFDAGDSAYVAAYIDGSFPPPAKPGEQRADIAHGYFANADMSGPIISAALHPEVLAGFPPTLITTGSRAADLSPAIVTNSQLLKAGVNSRLIVGEAMGHCYQYFADLAEAQDAYDATVSFFKENL